MAERRLISGLGRPCFSRRRLLQSGLALAAWTAGLRSSALGAVKPARAPRPAGGPDSTRWALLSDTHIAPDPEDRWGGFCPYRNLQEVIAQVAGARPDGVVITGDLARLNGGAAAYRNLKALLTPLVKRPVYLGLGNHDDRSDFLQVFGSSGAANPRVADKHVVVAEAGPVRLMILDTLGDVNAASGRLGEPQCLWLQTALRTCDDKPTLLLLHHPPRSDLLDMQRLLDIIGPQRKVKAIICGHLHKYEFDQVAGIYLIHLPATAFPIFGQPPLGWVEANLTRDGGRFTLHALAGNRQEDGRTERLFWRM